MLDARGTSAQTSEEAQEKATEGRAATHLSARTTATSERSVFMGPHGLWQSLAALGYAWDMARCFCALSWLPANKDGLVRT